MIPEIDDGRIDGSVEPIASSGVAPSTRIAGVVRTAPPMPNMPDSTPLDDADRDGESDLKAEWARRRRVLDSEGTDGRPWLLRFRHAE